MVAAAGGRSAHAITALVQFGQELLENDLNLVAEEYMNLIASMKTRIPETLLIPVDRVCKSERTQAKGEIQETLVW